MSRSPLFGLLLDVDGPIASPVTRTIAIASIARDLVALANAGNPVVFNTGRSDAFIAEQVVPPMLAAGLAPGAPVWAVCEKGAVWAAIDVDGLGEIHVDPALAMPADERKRRMRALHEAVARCDVHEWVRMFLAELDVPPAPPPRPHRDLAAATLAAATARQTGDLCLLLDYDGSLVDYAPRPELAVPDAELLALLQRLAAIESLADALRGLTGPPPRPRWSQDWFPRLDGAALYAAVRLGRPRRVLEIGSGHSTRFVAQAVADGDLACAVTCIDPQPRADVVKLPQPQLDIPSART